MTRGLHVAPVLLGYAVTQKLTTLDERLLEMGILLDGLQVPPDL